MPYQHNNRDPNLNNLHHAMDYNSDGEPIIRVMTYGSGGSMDLTALSVITDTALDGGSLEYDSLTGVFTFRPADLQGLNLGNFEINGPDLQSLSGTVLGADIVLNPNGGSVQVPSLKIGTGGNLLDTTLYIEAFITTYELVSIVDHSNTVALDTGVYGNINGVSAPWTVFELAPGVNGTPISAVEINDILTGVGIIPSTVGDRGTGIYSNYVIVNLDLEGLGQVLPITGAVFNLTRPLNKANLNIQSATNSDIFLDSQGLGDVIVNTNILPLTTNISTLGSPTKRWKSVYVGPGTIYVLDETLGKDIAIGARDGLLYIQNGSGLQVGEFTFIDNQLRIANPARDMIIGSVGATASVVFNRAIKVKDSLGALAFEVDRSGITSIFTPGGADPNKGTLNIIGTASGLTQPRGTLYDGTLLHLTAQDGKSSRISSDSFGTGTYPLYAGRAARGTVAAPTASQSGDILSRFSAVGYGDSEYKTGISRFDAVAAENFTNSAAGTKFSFQTTPVGSIAAQLSATIDNTGLSFVGNGSGGITFSNSDRLTYFPTPVSQADKWLKSNGTTMSWQTLPVAENPLIYKGAWNAFTNHPPLTQTTANDLPAVSGWEYSIEATGTRDLGDGSQTYEQGGFVIYNGSSWEYIPPLNGVSSIRFDSGTVYTGAVLVQSFDIVNTLSTNSLGNDKLANSSVTVTAGTGLSGGGTVSLGGTITLTNAGVTSITAGTGISVTGANGAKTISNTGVLSVTGTNHISASVVSGAVTVTSDATTNDTNNTIALRDGAGGLIAKDFSATRDASLATDHGPFNYGDLSYSDTGIMADFSMSTNSYNQVILQNRSAGTAASTNYIVSNNQGTANTYYGEFGMNSSGYTGTGSFALPNAVYLGAVSGDLIIGTLGNNTLRIVTNNSSTDAVTVNASGVATFANQIVGSISGSANNVRQAVTFATSGGAAPGSTFNGASALTVDYSTVGAQAPLSSGVNIKTVNNNNLVGSGNVSVGTVTSVGGTGTVSGITLTGSVSTTGNLTLGGTVSGLTTSNLSSTANIANSQLANSTISGVSLGGGLYNLKPGTNISFVGATNYNGSTEVTVNVATGAGYSYTLPVATASVLGGVKQGSNVTIDAGGVISVAAPYTLPTAGVGAGGTLGGVKVDGTTVTISSGIISAVNTAGVGGNQLVYELNASLNLTSAKNTLVSMFGLTSGVALTANTRYQYEIVFTLSSNKAGAISYALALGGGAVVAQHNFQWMANKTATIDGYGAGIAMASFNATGAAITTAKDIAAFDNFTHVVIYGNIDVTTAGNVNFMLSQDQNTPIVWTMLPGAYVRLLPIGVIGANTAAGTWA